MIQEIPDVKKCELCNGDMKRPRYMKPSVWKRRMYCSEMCRSKARRVKHAAKVGSRKRDSQPADEFIQDIELLLYTDTPYGIEKRMGRPLKDMRARLRRLGRGDLAERLLMEQERYDIEGHYFGASTSRCA